MDSVKAMRGRGGGTIPGIVLALVLVSAPVAAETTKDFTATTNDGSIITNDATGGYDFSGFDSGDAGKDASTSGTSGTGGGGPAGRRDDSTGCSCSVEQSPGAGLVALVLLLLALRRRKV